MRPVDRFYASRCDHDEGVADRNLIRLVHAHALKRELPILGLFLDSNRKRKRNR